MKWCTAKQEFRKDTLLDQVVQGNIKYLDGTSRFYQGHGKTVSKLAGEMVQFYVLSQQSILPVLSQQDILAATGESK